MSKQILLVEDEALIALNEVQMLKKHGYEVVTAYNGEKAVELVNNDPEISLILMDIDLGKGIDGPEAAEKILSRHELPIVFFTSHSEKEYVEKVKKITNYGYVLKNSGKFVLIESIQMAFELFEANKKLKKENEKRKKIEAALREEEEELSAIYEHTPVLMIIVDRDRRVRKANAFATEFAGSPAEELIGKRGGEALRCVHHLDDPKGCGFGPFCEQCKVRRTVMASFDKQKSFKKLESTLPFIRNRSAKEITFLLSTSYLEIKEEPLVIVSIEDITERKKLEEDIKRSEEKYRLLFNYSNDAIFVHEIGEDNLPGKNIDVNERAASLLRYSREELLHMSAKDVVPEKLAPSMFQHAQELMEKKHLTFETENIRNDGVVIPVEVSAYRYQEKGKQFAVASVRDITERKQVEMKLRESEKIFRQMFTKHHAIMLLIDPDTGKIVNANAAASRYYGFSVEELCQMTIQQINTMPAKEVAYERTLAAKEKRNHFFFSHCLSNGEIRDVEVHSTLIEVAEKKVLFSIVHDITERRQAEEALRESVLRFDEMVARIPVGVYIIWIREDERMEFEYVSDPWCAIHKVRREDVIADAATANDLVHPDEREGFIERNQKAARDRKPFLWEGRFVLGDGDLRWLRIESTPVVFENGDIRWFGVTQDITERKNTEKALAKKTTLLEESQELANLGSWEWDIVDDTWVFSEQWKQIHGVSDDDLKTSNLLEIAHPEDAPYIEKAFSEAKEEGKPYNIQHRIIRADNNETRYIHALGVVEYSQDTCCPLRMVGTAQDITELKRAEVALKAIGDLLDATQRIAKVGGWEWDVVRQEMAWSDQTYLIHGFEPGEFTAGSPELIQRSLACYDPDDRPKIERAFLKCVEEGEAYTLEFPLNTVQDCRIWIQTSAQAVLEGGRVVKVQGHIMDITERKRAEENLREALKEKDFLMKELNHRVKNSLLMVSSLINIKDTETAADLSDIKHQIGAISLIHEKLYQTENVTEIGCRDYISDLLNSIFSSFSRRPVRIEANIGEISIPTKSAMSLGLIVNEIATNAIKHGFNEKEEAVFSIKMERRQREKPVRAHPFEYRQPFP